MKTNKHNIISSNLTIVKDISLINRKQVRGRY